MVDWEVKTLNQVSENLDNERVPITKKNRSHGLIPYYGASGIVDYVEEHIFDEDLLLVSEDGANLLALTYPIAFSISGKTWVNNHAHVLRFENKITQRFVELYLNSIKLDDFVSGMAQPKLNQKMLNKIPLPFPPIFEQKRIVAILDGAFESIAKAKENAENNLKNVKEVFENYLQNVFENKGDGWEEKTLGAVCKISSKLINPREETYIDLCHVGGANIESITGCLIDLKTSKEEKLISGKFTFNNSMVLYSKIRPYLVKVVRPDFSGICSADIYPLKPVDSILDRDFLYFLLLTKDFTNFAIKGSDRAGIPKVNRKHLFSYSTFFPPLSEQQSIVQKLDALSAETKKLEKIYIQKLADLEELKKSILAKAFNSELTEASA
jgi:type I restriction enzyme S subunit